jgi:hypothetical protein
MDSIKEIKKWATEISGEWSGEESGSQEDRAGQANDILEAITNLEELIAGMENL